VGHLGDVLLYRVEAFEGRHQLARGVQLDREPAAAHGTDAVRETLGVHPDARRVLRPGGHHPPVQGILRPDDGRGTGDRGAGAGQDGATVHGHVLSLRG
jgi:hypothetical protein